MCREIVVCFLLSERHPEKQGLKQITPTTSSSIPRLSERHPEKQGLKLEEYQCPLRIHGLSERHPEKQGLKLVLIVDNSDPFFDFQSVIQKNKD